MSGDHLNEEILREAIGQISAAMQAIAEQEAGQDAGQARGLSHIGHDLLRRFDILMVARGVAVQRTMPPEGLEGKNLNDWMINELERVLAVAQGQLDAAAMTELLKALYALVQTRGQRADVSIAPLAIDAVRPTRSAARIVVRPTPAHPAQPAQSGRSTTRGMTRGDVTEWTQEAYEQREREVLSKVEQYRAELQRKIESLSTVTVRVQHTRNNTLQTNLESSDMSFDQVIAIPIDTATQSYPDAIAKMQAAGCWSDKHIEAITAIHDYQEEIQKLLDQYSLLDQHLLRGAIARADVRVFGRPAFYASLDGPGKGDQDRQNQIFVQDLRQHLEKGAPKYLEAFILLLGMAERAAWGEDYNALLRLRGQVAGKLRTAFPLDEQHMLLLIGALPGYWDMHNGSTRENVPALQQVDVLRGLTKQQLSQLAETSRIDGQTFWADVLGRIDRGYQLIKQPTGSTGYTTQEIQDIQLALSWRAALITIRSVLANRESFRQALAG